MPEIGTKTKCIFLLKIATLHYHLVIDVIYLHSKISLNAIHLKVDFLMLYLKFQASGGL